MHAGYACQDEGACCTAGWPIPIERPQADRVHAALAAGRFSAPVRWLGVAAEQPQEVAGVIAVSPDGCVFHHGRRCAIQTTLGHDALPSCCQHFPRDYVIDDRGVFVTLSHYCPTAARLLFAHDGPLAIVERPLPITGAPQGLDARGTLPPLLTADVLMDLPALTAWETHLVSWLGGWRNPGGRFSPERTLACLEADAQALATWRPGKTSLPNAIATLESRTSGDEPPRWKEEQALRQIARAALVPSYTWPDDPPDLERRWAPLQASWRAHAPAINRFLAAHAFASWLPYQGGDVVSGIRRLRLALAVLRAEAVRASLLTGAAVAESALHDAIRQTDLLLLHLVDRPRLARLLTARGR